MHDPLAPYSEIPRTGSGVFGRRTSASNDFEYLVQLRQHLNVAFELLDEQSVPILPPGVDPLGKRLRRVLQGPDATKLSAAVEHVLTASQSHIEAFDGLRVVFSRIVGSNPLHAAVVAVAEPGEEVARAQGPRATELMAGWLAQLIGRPLGQTDSARHTEWRQISSFCRAVAEESVLGSQTALVRVFVEALAIWDDLDVRGYAAELNGRFSQNVTLGGADPSLAPAELDPSDFAHDGILNRLAPVEAARLGFGDAGVSVAIVRAGTAPPWLLVLIGDLQRDDEPRLVALIGVLREALGAAHAIETSRLTWALLQCLVGDFDSVENTIRRALGELESATGLHAAATLTRRDGAVVAAIGDDAIVRGQRPAAVSRSSVNDSYELALALAPEPSGRALVRHQRLVDLAGSLVVSWVATMLKRVDAIGDRRAFEHRFDDLLQRQIRFAHDSGTELAVMLVRAGSAEPTVVQRWVRELRGCLRAGDIATALPNGDVAIVLPDTTFGEAVCVAERLRRAFSGDPGMAALASAPAGIVSLNEREVGRADVVETAPAGEPPVADARSLLALAQSRARSQS
jgi:hypothetical protein